MKGKRAFIVQLKNLGDWTEQLIYADEVISVDNEPLVFVNDDKSIAGLFAADIVDSWSEIDTDSVASLKLETLKL